MLNDIYEGLPFTDQTEFLAIGKSNPGSYFRLSHYIGDGVGVSDSLTVFETFQPLWNGATSLWFFDGRFVMRNNVINESRFAGSAGIGFRQLFDSEVGWGASGWFDIDELNRNQYQQLGVSLERFGRFWDLRANGYFPVGTERNNSGVSGVGQNLAFTGNLLAFARTRLDEVAMKGVDIEAGTKLWGRLADRFNVRIYGGGYHFQANEGDKVWGARARLIGNLTENTSTQVLVTSDDTFGDNLILGLSMYFGGSRKSSWTIPAGWEAPGSTVTVRGQSPTGLLASYGPTSKMNQPVLRQFNITVVEESIFDPVAALNADNNNQ
ncbi:MAG: inverse autotransporter beta domain-containing protein, partial [Pseudomonadales bacterium]